MGRLSAALLALTLALPLPVVAATVLLQNARFTDASGGVPNVWRLEAWARDLTDVGWEPGTDGGVVMLRKLVPVPAAELDFP